MRFDSSFDLVAEIARIHSKDLDLGVPQVHFVPVVVNDLSRVLPALEALCSIGNRVLMNAVDDPRLGMPVPAAADPIRRAGLRRS